MLNKKEKIMIPSLYKESLNFSFCFCDLATNVYLIKENWLNHQDKAFFIYLFSATLVSLVTYGSQQRQHNQPCTMMTSTWAMKLSTFQNRKVYTL